MSSAAQVSCAEDAAVSGEGGWSAKGWRRTLGQKRWRVWCSRVRGLVVGWTVSRRPRRMRGIEIESVGDKPAEFIFFDMGPEDA